MCDHPLAEEVLPQFQSASPVVGFQLMSSVSYPFTYLPYSTGNNGDGRY